MTKSILSSVIVLIAGSASLSQPSTEVFLFDLQKEGNIFKLSNPINISQNEGYDNQPHFVADGSAVLYTGNYNGQTDIVKYDLKSKSKTRITSSEGSEYSPTPDLSGDFITTIILEKDGRQLLWKYPINGGVPSIMIPEKKVGYHCWVDKQTIVSFVLGEPATLEVFDTESSTSNVLDKNIGRSIHKIPNSKLVSYVSKEDTIWVIKSIDPTTGSNKKITTTLPRAEDMAWSKDGSIIMGKGDKLYQYTPKSDEDWTEIAQLGKYGLKDISRISISPKNDKIAIVVAE